MVTKPLTESRLPAWAGAVHWRRSLRTRIALWSGAVNLTLLLLLLLATAGFTHRMILDQAHHDTLASAQEIAQRMDTALGELVITNNGMVDLLASADLGPDELTSTLRSLVRTTPGCTGGLLILEAHTPDTPAFARYISTVGQDRDLLAEGIDYRTQAWYQHTLSSPGGGWSEPYFSQMAGGVWMISYNVPLRRPGDSTAASGMIGVDMPLSTLTQNFANVAHLHGWRIGLVAPAGTLASHPLVRVEEKLTLDQFIQREGRTDLQPIRQAIRQHQPLQITHTDTSTGEKRFTVVQPVGRSGWTLLIAQSHDLIIDRLQRILAWLLVGGTLLALVCSLLVRWLAGHISQPVEQLTAATAYLAEGQYQTPVPYIHRHDEVGLLARTLEHARVSIRQQLVEIQNMGTARQKLESELSIARDIQLAMLPPGRTLVSGPQHLEVFALLEPAKAVGGDFYSFIESGDGRLWFAIGDVSDKGVPAALFMARTATVLEVAARSGDSPASVLAEASRSLVEGNDTCMFATVLLGNVDPRSGQCVLASAGHDPPLLLYPDGTCQSLPVICGAPLGFEVSHHFPLWQGQLPAGTTLLAFTDGVTEALDASLHAFGMTRLMDSLHPDATARAQCEHLIAQVHAFAQPAPQSDDLTVLAIRLHRDHGTHPLQTVEDTPC